MVHSYLNLLINLSLFLSLFHCVDSARVHKWAITIKCEQQKMHFAFLKYSEISLQFVTCFGHGKCQNAQMAKWQVAIGNWQLASAKCALAATLGMRQNMYLISAFAMNDAYFTLSSHQALRRTLTFDPKKHSHLYVNVCMCISVRRCMLCCVTFKFNFAKFLIN